MARLSGPLLPLHSLPQKQYGSEADFAALLISVPASTRKSGLSHKFPCHKFIRLNGPLLPFTTDKALPLAGMALIEVDEGLGLCRRLRFAKHDLGSGVLPSPKALPPAQQPTPFAIVLEPAVQTGLHAQMVVAPSGKSFPLSAPGKASTQYSQGAGEGCWVLRNVTRVSFSGMREALKRCA